MPAKQKTEDRGQKTEDRKQKTDDRKIGPLTSDICPLTSVICPLILPSVWHRSIDGVKLIEARERLELSQTEFASRCCWSKQYQSQLEAPGIHEISLTTAQTIESVLGS